METFDDFVQCARDAFGLASQGFAPGPAVEHVIFDELGGGELTAPEVIDRAIGVIAGLHFLSGWLLRQLQHAGKLTTDQVALAYQAELDGLGPAADGRA